MYNAKVKNYEKALQLYKDYSKEADFKEMKDVYLEIANCYYKLNENKKAIKHLKMAFEKYGLTEDVFIYNDIVNKCIRSISYNKISKCNDI